MKKKPVTPKTRVNKAKAEFEAYKLTAVNYLSTIRARMSVEHSRTPSIVTREGKTGPANILVNELTTVVKTASKLDKLVVLGIDGENLVILLEDKIPAIPLQLFY